VAGPLYRVEESRKGRKRVVVSWYLQEENRERRPKNTRERPEIEVELFLRKKQLTRAH
jgi:hypothetical protein